MYKALLQQVVLEERLSHVKLAIEDLRCCGLKGDTEAKLVLPSYNANTVCMMTQLCECPRLHGKHCEDALAKLCSLFPCLHTSAASGRS